MDRAIVADQARASLSFAARDTADIVGAPRLDPVSHEKCFASEAGRAGLYS
jgi:hypothetical protein